MFQSIKKNEQLMSYIYIVLGSFIGASAYPLFLVPNSIAPGGLTGVATIFNHFFHWPVGFVSLILNIPLFLFSYKTMGKDFVIKSIIATLLFSAMIDIFPFKAVTDNMLLSSIYGGIVVGFGLGLILKGGATTGGTDMIARLLHRWFPHISVGGFLFAVDFCVISAAGIFIGVESALYALINIYVASVIIDVVMQGLNRAKACYIISNNSENIRQRLMAEMDRGLTIIEATGGYTMENRPVLLCVVNPAEVVNLKNVIQQEDARAFMFITEAYEVLGEGFKEFGKD